MTTEQKIQEIEDQAAIRKLVDSYAYCADTRNAQGQMSLFTEDTRFEVYYDPKSDMPSQVIINREDLFPVFDNLNTYDTTMHFNGQSTVTITNDHATGITYCMAHHLTKEEGGQKFMVAAIRYYDQFVKKDGKWLFAERKLLVDWIENR
ncbi:nuclear transport factor 2 family protein [Chryseobacterium polytrichastri]|uniref:SnoaL-like domain-containing protein n=1 Tax=Chryseobacterium polytrichastri TaxID=1302687 RepID=A0A1M7ANV5_9FLAO|nr:nuclear transport factor 2 family protein [Chryseobacterium polytrichastri]SHL44236.1 SnoaL-like domain-containing protein [Chryseobacterium polytrichastri]